MFILLKNQALVWCTTVKSGNYDKKSVIKIQNSMFTKRDINNTYTSHLDVRSAVVKDGGRVFSFSVNFVSV